MTLFEIALPEAHADDGNGRMKTLKELISAMEQFYSGMLSVEHADKSEPAYFTLELAVAVNSPTLQFYAAVPHGKKDLFEKQLLSIFPEARIAAQPNDYNVFTEDGVALGSYATLKDRPMLPLKDYSEFDYDPLNAVLNAFAKIDPEGEGASLQILISPRGDTYVHHYRRILAELRKGENRYRAFNLPETFAGDLAREAIGLLGSSKKTLDPNQADKVAIEQMERKISAPIVDTNIRIVVSSRDEAKAQSIRSELEAAFNQFENTIGNRLAFKEVAKGDAKKLFHNYTFRMFSKGSALPLSLRELTALYHFPPKGIESAPHLVQSRFTEAAAPPALPKEGLLLGTNDYRGLHAEARLPEGDRARHLYVIGQTGTGKTSFMKTLIEQDIKAGNGVCFIDPHGNDIIDVLASIPPERYEDVIYFDPAELSRPFGLNLLEYDANFPEQKTFVVNELLAIFRRLYGDVPESMGPAFEQYFRNATLLVMEDPDSGSTLMDISRVLSNKPFRDLKLSRSKNPIVKHLVAGMNGKVFVESQLGKGSCFTVRLDLVR
jgi:hypothetical protein